MAVAFDAVGPSSSGASSTSSATLSWTHTNVASGVDVVAGVSVDGTDAGMTATCTIGGTSATSLGRVEAGGGGSGFLQVYRLTGVASGAVTVTVTVSGTIPNDMTGGSISFTGVTSIGTPVTLQNSSTNPSLNVTGVSASSMVAGFYASGNTIGSPSGGGTSRFVNNLEGGAGAGTGNGAGSTNTGTGTVAIGWTSTSTSNALMGVELQAGSAAASITAAQPGRTWARRFRHPQKLLPIPVSIVTAGPAGAAPGGVVYRRRPARALIAGLAAVPLIAQAAVGGSVAQRPAVQRHRAVTASAVGVAHYNGSRPGGVVVQRQPRQRSRAVAGYIIGAPLNQRGSPPGGVVRRRSPARAVTAHITGVPGASVTLGPAGNPPGGIVVRRQRTGVTWGGLASSLVTSAPPVAGSKPGGQVNRRRPARAVTGHTAGTAHYNGSLPGGVVRRRTAARAVAAGTVVRTTNATPPRGALQPHPFIGRRAPARSYARWIPVATTNAPPPAFQVARSTPTVTAPDTSAPSVTDPRDGTNTVTAIATSSPGVT